MSYGKTLIIHDMFEIRGGGERMMLLLANALNADLMFAWQGGDSFALHELKGKVINLNVRKSMPGLRTYHLAKAFSQLNYPLDAYENIIYSGVVAPLAVQKQTKGQRIFYCHTPPRFIYDQAEYYSKQLSWPARKALSWLNKWFKPRYEKAVKQMDVVLTNSDFVADRIETFLSHKAHVVYPPCDIEEFAYQLGDQPYYLSTARLDGLKRVDKIIDAFIKMPEKKLIVVSGGDALKPLMKLAEKATNIEFVGWVEDSQLKALINQCLATIYIPKDEDFGMSPVESMAAGKPVFCSDHGGLLETVVDGKTGFHINEAEIIADLIKKITATSTEELIQMRTACEKRAQLFSNEVCIQAIKKELQ